jgi:pyruvate/2-oxoglutarate dehydrogenase complex dihydrolipoamide acyltransferase (E2) component
MSEEIAATSEAVELAEKNNVDLSEVEGTGTDGKVLKGNVQDFIDAREPAEESEPEQAEEEVAEEQEEKPKKKKKDKRKKGYYAVTRVKEGRKIYEAGDKYDGKYAKRLIEIGVVEKV